MVFISWRLPDDPGGITCMGMTRNDITTLAFYGQFDLWAIQQGNSNWGADY